LVPIAKLTKYLKSQIRDRIRCFFKTHIQNAKKRLKTLLKNQHKKENQKIIQVARTAVMSATGVLPPANKDMSTKLGLAYKRKVDRGNDNIDYEEVIRDYKAERLVRLTRLRFLIFHCSFLASSNQPSFHSTWSSYVSNKASSGAKRSLATLNKVDLLDGDAESDDQDHIRSTFDKRKRMSASTMSSKQRKRQRSSKYAHNVDPSRSNTGSWPSGTRKSQRNVNAAAARGSHESSYDTLDIDDSSNGNSSNGNSSNGNSSNGNGNDNNIANGDSNCNGIDGVDLTRDTLSSASQHHPENKSTLTPISSPQSAQHNLTSKDRLAYFSNGADEVADDDVGNLSQKENAVISLGFKMSQDEYGVHN